MVLSSDLAVVRIDGAPEHAPIALDARCARMTFARGDAPICCARGAPIDLRSKVELMLVHPSLVFSPEGPTLDSAARSGVVERLADVESACAALDRSVPRGGVFGDGCSIRAAARTNGRPEDVWLLDACALFPLDVSGETLVPSPRIATLVEVEGDEPTLWDQARARVALRFGEAYAAQVDEAARAARQRKSKNLHLRTLR